MMRILMILMLLFMNSSCMKSSPQTHFYLLQPLASKANTSKLSIGVGPIKIPAYLDRSQIVTQTDINQMKLAEFARWAEPLQDNFSRTLTENIQALSGSDQIIKYPWPKTWNPNYQIEMEIEKFHTNAKGISELQVQWSIRQGQKILLLKHSSLKTQASSLDYQDIVFALSQAIEQLSEQIVNTIHEIETD